MPSKTKSHVYVNIEAEGYDDGDEDNDYDDVKADEANRPRNQEGYAGPESRGKSKAQSDHDK